MRHRLLIVATALLTAACSDSGVSPTTSPDGLEINASHEQDGGTSTGLTDECGGLSPCDAYLNGGPAGFCFIPPMTDNHLSEAACSAPFVPSLPDGALQLEWCEVVYPASGPPTAPTLADPLNCGGPLPLTWDGTSEFYETSVKFSKGKGKNDPGDVGKTYRLYIVAGVVHLAHRDVIVDPNATSPADADLLAVGTGNTPVKVKVTEAVECDDGTDGTVESCLITSGQSFSLGLNGTQVVFGNVNDPFFLNASLDCGEDGHVQDLNGDPAVDLRLPGCKVTINGDFTLDDPAFIQLCDNVLLEDYFAPEALGVLHREPEGMSVLPRVAGCLNVAARESTGLFGKLASWLGIKPLVATATVGPLSGGGGSFFSNSDFELAVLSADYIYNEATSSRVDDAAMLDLGTVPGGTAVPVAVQALALCDTDGALDEDICETGTLDAPVPGQAVHFFALGGSVSCDGGAGGSFCSTQTDTDGIARAAWTPGAGESYLKAISCGAGIYGSDLAIDASLPEGSVQGLYAFCDRNPNDTDDGSSGPANGWQENTTDPFAGILYGTAPSQVLYESGINDLPLTWKASSCPTITVDGVEGTDGQGNPNEWVDGCVEKTAYTVNLSGPKTGPNAWLYTTNDGTNVYVALKVKTSDLLDVFLNFQETPVDGTAGANDDLLLLRTGGTSPGVFTDNYLTASCAGNTGKSFCGSEDDVPDGDAQAKVTSGYAFYEFGHPWVVADKATDCEDAQDYCVEPGDELGVYATTTGGSGGGKGNFIIPDYRVYLPITIK